MNVYEEQQWNKMCYIAILLQYVEDKQKNSGAQSSWQREKENTRREQGLLATLILFFVAS